jgi:integrase
MTVLSEEQGNRLLVVTRGDRFEALYVLALTTGMRQGELLGLRWQDVDLERAIAHVQMSVQEADGHFILAEVKTSHSRRNIALTRLAVKALRAHRARQNEERLAMGSKWNSASDLVFPNGYGGIMIPDNVAKRSFKAALLRAGLPDMRFHDLRHTAATLLLSRGVHPKVVSEMLGHADIAITLRVYAHVLPNMQLAAVTLMDTLFGGQVGGQATEEEPSERPVDQAHETQTVVKTVVKAEKDEAQAASDLGS